MAAIIPVPGEPGRVVVAQTGQVVQQDLQYEGDYFDSNEFTAFTAGTKQVPFKDRTNKELHHTNFTREKRIPSKAKLKLKRIGLFVRPWVGNARPSPEDVVALYDLLNFRMYLGKTNLIAEGYGLQFPPVRAVTGTSTAPDFSILSNGIPSPAAVPPLLEQPDVSDEMDLNAELRVDGQTWLNASDQGQPTMVGNGTFAHLLLETSLHGIITTPLGG